MKITPSRYSNKFGVVSHLAQDDALGFHLDSTAEDQRTLMEVVQQQVVESPGIDVMRPENPCNFGLIFRAVEIGMELFRSILLLNGFGGYLINYMWSIAKTLGPEFQPLPSKFGFPASTFQLLLSNFQLPASTFQLSASIFHLPLSNFQLPILTLYSFSLNVMLGRSVVHSDACRKLTGTSS